MIVMKLVEGTLYSRRLDQPSSVNFRTREYVDYLFCSVPSDSEDEPPIRKKSTNQARKRIRLDNLLQHYKEKHKDAFPAEGRSLLDMGFIVAVAVEAAKSTATDKHYSTASTRKGDR